MDKELDIQGFIRLPGEANSTEVAEVFEGIYRQEYLEKDTNDLLIQNLIDIQPWFQDKIAAGLPEGVETAHKIGELNGVHADAGIIYGEERDYVLVVLNKNISNTAVDKTKRISEVVYTYLNSLD